MPMFQLGTTGWLDHYDEMVAALARRKRMAVLFLVLTLV
jgi:hypothetical protein